MKILAIRGRNLASLEGDFEIDFTQEPLKSAGIFTIVGSTGSGKSTILDALCIALFNKTPRSSRATENTVNVADVGNETLAQGDCRNILRRGTGEGFSEVDFVALDGVQYRASWMVKRARSKENGKLQQSEMRLTNLLTNLEVGGKNTEILEKIEQLIGLSFEQFTRSVLLAQGDFATFLRAKQSEKAELLEKLTGTEIYTKISVKIFEKSNMARLELASVTDKIKGIELLGEEQIELLKSEKESIAKETITLKENAIDLKKKVDWIILNEALTKGVADAVQSGEQAQKAIEESKPLYDSMAKIESVQEIRDSFVELVGSKKQLADNNNQLIAKELERTSNATLLKESETNLNLCDTELATLLAQISKAEPEIIKARALDIQIIDATKNQEEAKKDYDLVVQAKSATERTISSTKEEIVAQQKKLDELSIWFESQKEYKDIIPKADLIISQLNDLQSYNSEIQKGLKTLAVLESTLKTDNLALVELKLEAERLQKLLPADIAELRSKLIEGKPCAVCGSLHHPIKLIEADSKNNLQEEEINRAKTTNENAILALTSKIEKSKEEFTRIETSTNSYKAQMVRLLATAHEILNPLPLWQTEFEKGGFQSKLHALAEKWKMNNEAITKTSESIGLLKVKLDANLQTVATTNESVATKENKFKTISINLTTLQTERAQLLGGKSADDITQSFNNLTSTLKQKQTQLLTTKTNLAGKQESINGVITQITKEISRLNELCTKLQLEIENWMAKKDSTLNMDVLSELFSKDANWVSTQKAHLSSLKDKQIAITATLTERKNQLQKHCELPHKPQDEGDKKEQLEGNLQNIEATVELKTKRTNEIEVVFGTFEKERLKLKSFEDELKKKGDAFENWNKLNDLLGSGNGQKFKQIAQAYTLEILLGYANKQLSELSKRYQLQRIPDTLALQVVDLDMLNEIRTVHSLSGGESFLISLALALGLSSLSSNRMKIESLFIDEGFGSLDADTLQIAMSALEQLQTQGRKIGVISHVAEMTERIAVQIQVVKSENGRSKVRVRG